MPANQVEENLVWKLISYFLQFYESYEIKFVTKTSSFTVYKKKVYFLFVEKQMVEKRAEKSWLCLG